MINKDSPIDNLARSQLDAILTPHSQYYQSSNPAVRWLNNARLKAVISLLGDIKDKEILDIGCGDGFIAQKLSLDGGKVHGIDISELRLKRTLSRVSSGANGQSSQVSLHDARQLGFADNAFDCVVCADVLEHADQPELICKEMLRVCRNKGKIVILVPNQLTCLVARLLFLRFPLRIWDHVNDIKPGDLASMMCMKPLVYMTLPRLPYFAALHYAALFVKN